MVRAYILNGHTTGQQVLCGEGYNAGMPQSLEEAHMCNGSALTEGKPHIVDNTGDRILRTGTESFEDMVERYVYVDKTLLVRDIMDGSGITLFCRPRRFGKSTAMRMLQCFFEQGVKGYIPDRRHLFDNLAVAGAGERINRERGAHPVIYLSLGGCALGSCQKTVSRIAQQVAAEYQRHAYLYDSPVLLPYLRPRFERLAAQEPTDIDLLSSLAWLSSLLAQHHDAKTVILIDEYDTPINDGYLRGYRHEIVDFYRSWLTDALKGTDKVFLAALTGVLRVSQESIFSELNNVAVNTTLDEGFDEAFGFTAAEAEELARYMGRKECIGQMRAWYDGYRFGGGEAYNPWSVLNYLRSGVAQPYWTNTSMNGIVRDLVARADDKTSVELAAVASGGTVQKPLDLHTVFDDLADNPEAVWPQMYQAGYLTTDDTGAANDSRRLRRLRVPNYEVQELFETELIGRARRIAGSESRLKALHAGIARDDPRALEEALRQILLDSPSFLDLADEGRCHMLLLALLYGVSGYRPPTSNRESGDGRSDVLLEPLPDYAAELPAIAIEVKRPKDQRDKPLDDEALAAHARDVALAQAVRMEYGHGLTGRGCLLWGVSFGGKHVACACEHCD